MGGLITRTAMEQIYDFMSDWYSDGRSEHQVCQGRRAFIEEFVSRGELADLFGGYVVSDNSSGEEFLGVWGRRKGQRFRRILRERGAQFTIGKDVPTLRVRLKLK